MFHKEALKDDNLYKIPGLKKEVEHTAKLEATVKTLQGEKDALIKKDAADTSKIESQKSELERLQQRIKDLESAPKGSVMPMMMMMPKEVEWLKEDEIPGLNGLQACVAWCCLPAEHGRIFARA